MKNITKFLGIIAAVAMIGLVTGCGEPDADDRIEITINGLDSTANGYFAMLSLWQREADTASVARSSALKVISDGAVTGAMVQSGKNFDKEGNYFIRLEVYNSETSENLASRVYDGMSTENQKIIKGTNQFGKSIFRPTITAASFPEKGTPAGSNFGTYTGTGVTDQITETIVLQKDTFRISDNSTNNAGAPTNDFLNFSITKWEEIKAADIPAAAVSGGYTGGYKFTGKITGGQPINAASGNNPSNIYGGQTAPNFVQADINNTEAWMYIYFKGTEETFTFIRTAFSKEGNENTRLITTGTTTDAPLRVYRKQAPAAQN